MSKFQWMRWMMTAATAAVLCGCQSSRPPYLHGETFEPEESPTRSVHTTAAAQTAVGAASDATLGTAHFDGAQINTLGQHKLDLMLDGQPVGEALVVYLDLPADAPAQKSRQSVADYLKGRGVAESQIRFQDGPNPRATGMATSSIAGLGAMSGSQAAGQSQGYSQPPAGPGTSGLTSGMSH